MSRYYRMYVEFTGFKKENHEAIEEAAKEEWPFEILNCYEDDESGHWMDMEGEGNLCGGEGEDEFFERLRDAVWKANKGYCSVMVRAYYLEDMPFEEYMTSPDDYKPEENISEIFQE